jgi:alpha-beta hydrolase superfamily lysophospholipase
VHADGKITASAGGDVYWQSWTPEKTKAVVVIAHGLAEHSGRYAHVADRLASAGYATYSYDQWGHGRSGGTMGNIEGFSHLRADLDTVLSKARGEHPGVPVFLLGHSFGGLVALDYVVTRGESGLTGLVVSGAAVDPSVGSALERAAAPLLSRIAPNLPVAPLDPTAVSRDPAVVQAYIDDPLNYHGKIRARTGSEGLKAVARVHAGLGRVTLPILVLHGVEDRLVSAAGSKAVAEKVKSVDKTLTLYDGLYHEIFNEPEQKAVLDDVVGWLDAHS